MKWVTRERPKIGASGTANPLSPIFGRGAKWIALMLYPVWDLMARPKLRSVYG